MSNGVYALLGVLLGGVVTAGVTWWQGWRAARTEWKTVGRLITDELERLMIDLADLIEDEKVPLHLRGDMLSTAAWDEHRATVARALPNDATADDFWRGLSRIYANTRELRWMLGVWTPGSELTAHQLTLMHADLALAARAFNSMSDVPAEVNRRPGAAELASGAQTGAQEPETPQ